MTPQQMDFTDICENRHGGNENSATANPKVCKAQDREAVFALVERYHNGSGITLKEACTIMQRLPNQISGRFSELRAAGRIRVSGRRKGCGVYFVKEDSA